MTRGRGKGDARLRYAANDALPHPASFVIGLHTAVLVCIPVVVVTTIVARVANQSDAYLSWAIFTGMMIGGLVTILQAVRVRGVGGANLIVMGTSGATIGVAVLALVAGGPPLLGALVVTSAICQFALAARLALLRRIITPLVSGTLIALVAVTVMPMGFEMLTRVPESASPLASPTIAAATIVTVTALMLGARRIVRAWTPLLGIAVGCLTAAAFGIVDFGRVAEASWLGVPAAAFPGLDLSFGPSFWMLLPGFLFVTFVITVRQVGDAVRIQRLSRHEQRAVDFGRVQGAVAAGGIGTLLSGLAGTPPPWPYPAGLALAQGIGVAARRAGIYIGAIFCALAFVPKIPALVVSIPPPVLGAYIIVVFAVTFAEGMRVALREGAGRRHSLVAGLSVWIGIAVQFRVVFPGYLGTPAGRMLANGLTAGGLAVLLLSLLLELTGPRRHRLEIPMTPDRLPDLDRFLFDFATRYRLDSDAKGRLRAASEEALQSLLRQEEGARPDTAGERRLRVVARNTRDGAVVEFKAATREGNLENQLVLLDGRPDPTKAGDMSLRLLRHYASSVQHHQYHDVDVLTVRVDDW